MRCRYDFSQQNEDISTSTFRNFRRLFTYFKKLCAICNNKRVSDNNIYNEGSIGRCKIN